MIALIVALLAADEATTQACVSATSSMLCHTCSASWGVGASLHICTDACDAWWSACQDAFFQASTTALRPCRVAGGHAPLLCAQLHEIATNGPSLCSLVGFEAAADDVDDGCWRPGQAVDTALCAHLPPLSHPLATRQASPWSLGMVMAVLAAAALTVWRAMGRQRASRPPAQHMAGAAAAARARATH